MMKKILIGVCFLSLAACDSTKEQLGMTKSAPDEFQVVKRAPLELPPNYVLRPPQPGAPRPQELSTSNEAAHAVFGETESLDSSSEITTGESALLQKAGGENIDPNIRSKVDSETVELHDRNKPVAEKLFGIGGDKNEQSASVVNAKKEAERIQKNAEEGKPVTEGETPSIEE